YYLAIDNTLNACLDTDGDGVGDLTDIDDDNDGVLDTTELSCGVGEAAVTNTVLTAGSQQIEGTFTNGSGIADYNIQFSNLSAALVAANIAPVAGGLHYIVDDTNLGDYETTIQITPQTGGLLESVEWGPDLVGNTDTENDNDEQTITLTWTPAVTAVVIDPDNQLDIADGTIINSGQAIFQGGEYENASPPTWKIVFTTNLISSAFALTTSHEALAGVADLRDEGFSIIANVCYGENTDGDGMINSLDLDSDGDGCSDSVEAGNTVFSNNDIINYNSGLDANGNGLLDQFENGTSGTINYVSTYTQYALDGNISGCLDTDNDGVVDIVDIDDDNDGVLDTDESQSCSTAIEPIITPVAIVSIPGAPFTIDCNTEGSLDEMIDGDFASNGDGCRDLDWTVADDNQGNGLRLTLVTVYDNISEFYLWNDVNLSSGVNDGIQNFSIKLYDKDAVLLGTETGFVAANAGAAMQSFSLSQTYNGVLSFDLVIETTYTRSPIQIREIAIGGPSARCSVDYDVDGDTTANRLDLDSDGDGCSDAYEAGATTDKTANFAFTNTTVNGEDTNGNGLADSIEDLPGNPGQVNYSLSYFQFAIDNSVNACADNDNDGIGDHADIDDDNDGVLDAVESPNCFYTETEATTIVTVTSDLTVESVSRPFSNAHDGADNTASYTGVTPNQNGVGVSIYEIIPTIPMAITAIDFSMYNLAFTNGAGNTVKLQGFTGSIWEDLDTASNRTVVNAIETFINTLQPNKVYQKFRITGETGLVYYARVKEIYIYANNFVSSLNPKTICNDNLDGGTGDILPNHFDPDSDGDGCSDAYEAGATSDKTTDFAFTNTSGNGEDVNGNGLADVVENGTTGTINYVSTYELYAWSDELNLCIDTDNDGVGDLVDLDDDNDGILDPDESSYCSNPFTSSYTIANAVFANNTTANATYTADILDSSNTKVATIQFLIPATSANVVGYADYSEVVNGDELQFNWLGTGTNPNQCIQYTITPEAGMEFNATLRCYLPGNGSSAQNNTISMTPDFGTLPNGKAISATFFESATSHTDRGTGDIISSGMTIQRLSNGVPGTTYSYLEFDVMSDDINPYIFNMCFNWSSAMNHETFSIRFESVNCTSSELDVDGDTLINSLDLDSDGDGCSDAAEGGVPQALGNTSNNFQFVISQGVGNGDENGNGLADEVEDLPGSPGQVNYTLNYTNAVDPAVNVACSIDSDGDGIDDVVDLDDDNDGIVDRIEGGGVDPGADDDNDGILNYADSDYPGYVDSNGDGINDHFDYDGDGVANHLDLDSDNDGLLDLIEAGGVDTDGDGAVDYPTPGDASSMV
ncbi:hypothetical protein ACFSTE_14110, partial [Aquimarina hainanensis]